MRRTRSDAPVGPHYRWVVLSNTTLAMLMATLNMSSVMIAMPAIFRGIHLDPLGPGNFNYLLWMLMGYMVVTAVLVVNLGRLGDMFGRVRMYNLGFVIFTVASIMLSLVWSTGPTGALELIVLRMIQAVGGAMLMANTAALLTDAFPAERRGMALGLTMQLPTDDRHNYYKNYLDTQIAILMGGRIAEELFLNQMSTGAGNDIERATELARKMVCEWGMSDLGPVTFGKKEEQIFLGREISQHRDYSEATAIQIDEEVRKMVSRGYATAKGILSENRETLIRIAKALIEREVLDASEIKMLVERTLDYPAAFDGF